MQLPLEAIAPGSARTQIRSPQHPPVLMRQIMSLKRLAQVNNILPLCQCFLGLLPVILLFRPW